MADNTAISMIDSAIDDISRIRSFCQKRRVAQIKVKKHRILIKSITETWFSLYRQNIQTVLANQFLQDIDTKIIALRDLTDRYIAPQRYVKELGLIKDSLVLLRSNCIKTVAQNGYLPSPDFKVLVQDIGMLAILQRRWNETQFCMRGTAHLSATVMMGGLLEALILAKINSLQAIPSKYSTIFMAKASPKDRVGKPIPLKEWTLQHYLDVANELGWISKSAKDVGVVLRDYRNFIHPYKELVYKIHLDERETGILWAVFVSIVQQLIESAK